MKKFSQWLKEIGVSEVTGWRWEKNGAVKVHRTLGRKFISDEEIARVGLATAGNKPEAPSAFQPLAPWLRSINVSQRTGLRWENAGVISVVRIRNRKYVTHASVERLAAVPHQKAA